MREYEYVTEDSRLIELVKEFEENGAIAIDFEEECNLHAYGEHISIIQIYDKKKFYIIDVLRGVSYKSLSLLFASNVQKIWFECHSDLSILFNKYKIKTKNVYDLRVLARALGDVHGLDEVLERFLGIKRDESKKKNQRENWMIRPLESSMISYALKDVEYLFDLKEVLDEEVKNKKLKKRTDKAMESVTDVKAQKPGWMKITNVRTLTEKERIYLRLIFNAREKIAERFNTPAVNVLEKKEIVVLAKRSPLSDEEIVKFLERAPERFRKLLIESVIKATAKGKEEENTRKVR